MTLLDFQTALGRAILAPNTQARPGPDLSSREVNALAALITTDGFRATVNVQRSWCRGRAAKGAWLTLSVLPDEQRQSLLDAWIAAGHGTTSFFAAEANAFLDFIASHLPAPSHFLSICRMEQATLRVAEAARHFAQPPAVHLRRPDCRLRVSSSAALVLFFAEPRLVLTHLNAHTWPPVSADITPLLFAPGIRELCRIATPSEFALWERAQVPVSIAQLLSEGQSPELIESLFVEGALEEA